VRGERTHVNQASRTWETRGSTSIKHLESERWGDSLESSTPMGWNSRHIHIVHSG